MREIDEDELRKNRLWVDAEQSFDELHQHEYILSFPKVRDTAILYIAFLLIYASSSASSS